MDKQKGFLEESLAESQGKDVCRAIFDGSPDAIFLADPKTGIVIDANPEAERLLGRPLNEIIGLHQTALHPPKRETASRNIFKEHSASNGRTIAAGPEEHYALRSDGTEVPIEITAKVIRIKGRKVLQGFFRDVSARKAAKLALVDSEEKFKLLTEKSVMGVYLIQDGIFRHVNPVLAQIFGYTPRELIDKKGPKELTYPDDIHLVDENTRKRFEDGVVTTNYGFRGVKKDGGIIYAEVFGSRIDYLGRPAIIGTLIDVTERRKAQEALRESEELYRSLVDNAPVGIILHYLGEIKFVNRKMAELGGFPSPRALFGKKITEFVHPDYHQQTALRIERLMSDRVPLPPSEIKLVAPDGKVYDMEMLSILVTYQGQDCVMTIVQDITTRKLAQKALQESEELYRTLVDHAPVGIVVHALGAIRFVNNRMAEIVRVADPAKLIGGDALSFVHPEDRERARGRTREITMDGRLLPPAEEKLIAEDGTVLDAAVHSVPIVYCGERCMLTMIEDITARKMAELQLVLAHRKLVETNVLLEERVEERTSQLEDLNKELEAFSYSAAHDLKAPLRRINIFSDMLEKEAGNVLKHDTHDYLVNIHKSATHMARLVDGLLALSTTGRKPLDMEPVQLTDLLEEAAADIKAENPGREIEWKLQKLPAVKCDRLMMRQVFINLLGNSAKYSRGRTPARIEVFYTPGAKEHVIAVRDNGVGFSMEFADKVFGVFQRLHRSEDFEGTGIGLSTVKRIIARHGGRVWAESETGAGSTFYFTLPAK